MSDPQRELQNHLREHYIHKSNWLRAAVLGANDGILSTASLAIGVASAGGTGEAIVLASLAGVVAGALSMAAGEYVSVSSQTDVEKADIERERKELKEMPELELERLVHIYESRGLRKETAELVSKELTEHDALRAHVRDELGINEVNRANPLQAAFSSGAAFTLGGALPLMATIVLPRENIEYGLYLSSLLFLTLLGAVSARTGGSSKRVAIFRIAFWGTVAMGLTALVGYLFGLSVSG
jgi:VIT1/CCC1 family predicted Fe2+/Mn2+ transporter